MTSDPTNFFPLPAPRAPIRVMSEETQKGEKSIFTSSVPLQATANVSLIRSDE